MDKDDDDTMMECESNGGVGKSKGGVGNQREDQSDLSVMRGMFTKEIALRRKAALYAKKMAEDQANSAKEAAKKNKKRRQRHFEKLKKTRKKCRKKLRRPSMKPM